MNEILVKGESDAETDKMANAYYYNLRTLINDVRNNFVKNPELPIVLGVDEQHQWIIEHPIIVEEQKQIAEEEKNIVFTRMIGLPKADNTHLTPAGLELHGELIYYSFIRIITAVQKKIIKSMHKDRE